MIRIILIVHLLLILCHAHGQTVEKKNTVYFQLGGNGLFASLNFERQLVNVPKIRIHAGIGNYGTRKPYVTIPIGINYLLNIKKSNAGFEFGIGLTYTKADVLLYVIVDRKQPYEPKENFVLVVPGISYRIQTKKHRMYKIGLTPVIGQYGLIPFIGFSTGKSF